MITTCKFCNSTFSNKHTLKTHQNTTKYCLKLQNKNAPVLNCDGCGKTFSHLHHLNRHIKTCRVSEMYLELLHKSDILEHENQTLIYKLKLYEHKDEENLILTNKLEEIRCDMFQLLSSSITNDKDKIKQLTDKYVKKRERKHYTNENVIYILTTPSLKKDRRYIMGKATNLTNRLSTYNKTDEHEVIFNISCGTKEDMGIVEHMVFKKLEDYREQANRERFILPETKDIDFFIQKIKDCVNFLK